MLVLHFSSLSSIIRTCRENFMHTHEALPAIFFVRRCRILQLPAIYVCFCCRSGVSAADGIRFRCRWHEFPARTASSQQEVFLAVIPTKLRSPSASWIRPWAGEGCPPACVCMGAGWPHAQIATGLPAAGDGENILLFIFARI